MFPVTRLTLILPPDPTIFLLDFASKMDKNRQQVEILFIGWGFQPKFKKGKKNCRPTLNIFFIMSPETNIFFYFGLKPIKLFVLWSLTDLVMRDVLKTWN